MTSVSPALHATRPAGWVDIKRPAEYPIVLGDSLRNSNNSHQFLNLRYNWQPKSGLPTAKSSLKPTDSGFRLSIKEQDGSHDPAFTYAGHARASADTKKKESMFALIFDQKESVFKLEAIAKSIDLNLVTTTSKSVEPRKLPKLAKLLAKQVDQAVNGDHSSPLDDEAPDSSNPFDFRNFLAEAKENAEKAVQANGGRTPLAGNRTPVSGFASPVPGATRFKPATPNFTPTSSAAPKKRRTDEGTKHSKLASPMRQKPMLKKKRSEERREPLSKDRISDSDDELSDTIEVKNTSTPLQAHSKGHSRNISGGFGRSPHIVVNDGDLEIDMGSPPQEARGRPLGRIDPGAFRSHTGTPVMGMSANRRLPSEDVHMTEPEQYHSEDGDVEELELGSPRTSRLSVHGSRSASIIEPRSSSVQEHAPTPPNQAGDDEDDLLAAEFEAALEEEDKGADAADRGQGYGLGITGASQRDDDDDEESEVSEEE